MSAGSSADEDKSLEVLWERVSRSTSGAPAFENLIETLICLVLEYAGAQRALLIRVRRDQHWIEAEATTSLGTVSVALRKARISSADLPESVLNFVLRSKD